MEFKSISYAGEWPMGVYWVPGVVRFVPARSLARAGEPPAGVEPVKAPAKAKKEPTP